MVTDTQTTNPRSALYNALWKLMALLTTLCAPIFIFAFFAFHSSHYRLSILVVAIMFLPALTAFLIRKSWLRGIFWPVFRPLDQTKPLQVLARSLRVVFVLPVLMGAGSLSALLYTLVSEPGSELKSWFEENIELIYFIALTPQVILAYVSINSGRPVFGIYIAASVAYIAFQTATGGMKTYDGILGYFGKWQAQASPILVLICALEFAASFGALHQGVHLMRPEEYQNMRTSLDALYFSVVTMTTVGYGDVVPVGNLARVLSIVEILCGVLMLVVAVSGSMTVWIQRRQPKPDAGTNSEPKDDSAGNGI